jgi:hypothetical protein
VAIVVNSREDFMSVDTGSADKQTQGYVQITLSLFWEAARHANRGRINSFSFVSVDVYKKIGLG